MRAVPVWLIDDAARVDDRDRALRLGIAPVATRPTTGFYLRRDAAGLALQRADADRNTRPLYCDFPADALRRAGRSARQSPLARACGLHRGPPVRVLDATAGFGRDAVTLAALGCTVQPIERQAVLFALLADAHERLTDAEVSGRPAWWSCLATPVHADAARWLVSQPASAASPDLVYMDPMFESTRRKARPQKALAWLAELAGPDADAATLLAVAREHAGARVVVKQHARAAPLTPQSHQITAKAIRFDVYLSR